MLFHIFFFHSHKDLLGFVLFPVLQMVVSQFVRHSPGYSTLGCFQFLVLMNKAVTNVHVRPFHRLMFLISLG